MLITLFVVVVTAASAFLVSRPEVAGQPRLWLYAMLPQLPIAVLALLSMARSGRLKERLTPHRGDVFLGVLTAVIMVMVTWAGRTLIMPHGSPRGAWLARLYLQLGNPTLLQATRWLPPVLIVGSMLDELVWRGWIQDRLSTQYGSSRGYAITCALYAVAAAPAMYNLADPTVGLNILFPLLALIGGLIWGYATLVSGRATPAMISHAAFVYFSVMQFRPGL